MRKPTDWTRCSGLMGLLTGGVLGLAFSAAPASASAERTPRYSAQATSATNWLAEINRYRAATGLAPVTDNPAWDAGIAAHLKYLEHTPSSYLGGQYRSAHTENPASPYYTRTGAIEAGYSDLAEGGAPSPLAAIDGWLAAPFHAIGMLRPQLSQVALADEPTRGYAGLDVIQGLDYSLPAAMTPILFPGPGITTNLLAFGGESPDPLETCGWQGDTVGLPLIALLTQAPTAALTASLNGPTGTESSNAGTLCVVDQNTYHSSDAIYGSTGLSILQGDSAVVLIPRRRLVNGRYSVDISQPGAPDIRWSFNAAPSTIQQPSPKRCRRTTIRSIAVRGHTVTIHLAAPAHARLRCALEPRYLGRWERGHYHACWPTTIYHGVTAGRYRLSVRSRFGDPSRILRVR